MADETEDLGEVIDSYRRRRERMGNTVIWALIVLAGIMGLVLVYVWLSGENGIALPFLSSPTPTPTATFTITPTSIATNTPLPTLVSPTLTATPLCPSEYTVKSGDTLSSIAQKCGFDSFQVLLMANPTIVNGIIHPGDKIKIPPPGTGITRTAIFVTPGTMITIIIEPGDTIQKLADRCHTTSADIVSSNAIKDQNKINAGDSIKCHYGLATPVPTRPTPTVGPSPTPSDTATTAPTSTRAT